MVSAHASRDSSVIASLGELRRLEAERLAAEREARERERTAAEAAQRETERTAAEERRARERREEEAWLSRARLEREEAARTAAMERALVERAKAEATARVLGEEREREHRRALELAQAKEGRALVWTRRIAVGLGASLVLGASIYAGKLAPQWERRIAEANASAMAWNDATADLRAKLGARESELAAARQDAAGATVRVAALEGELARLRQEAEKGAVKRTTRPPTTRAPQPSQAGFDTHCDPASHDPLCASFGR
jgi:hypothetical protein